MWVETTVVTTIVMATVVVTTVIVVTVVDVAPTVVRVLPTSRHCRLLVVGGGASWRFNGVVVPVVVIVAQEDARVVRRGGVVM